MSDIVTIKSMEGTISPDSVHYWQDPETKVWNPSIEIEGKKARLRAGILIVKDGKYILIGEEEQEPGVFSLPGGGIDKGETPVEAAVREAKEEVKIEVENARDTGCDYCVFHTEVMPWVKEHVPEEEWWQHYYTCLVIADYKEPFKGEVNPEDEDETMESTSQWLPIEEAILDPSFKEQWKQALIKFGYLNSKEEDDMLEEDIEKHDKLNEEVEQYNVIKTHDWYDPEGLNIPNDSKDFMLTGSKEDCLAFLKDTREALIDKYADRDDITVGPIRERKQLDYLEKQPGGGYLQVWKDEVIATYFEVYFRSAIAKEYYQVVKANSDQAKQESLDEDIEKHDKLNPVLFDDNELKPEIKEAINNIVNTFVDDLKEDEINLKVKDVILVGSNVSYNYTKDSDLDIHIIADSSKLDCSKEICNKLYSAYRSIFNNKYDITLKGIPAEIYVELDEPQVKSNGIYSLNTGWVKEPVQTDIPDLDEAAFEALFQEWEDKYFELLGRLN